MLERRECTAEKPMPMEDKDRFFWIHADAVDVGPFLSAQRLYTCPHCKFTFHAGPKARPVMWTLDENRQPVPCADAVEWAMWMGTHDEERRVGQDTGPMADGGTWWLSTAFLGLDLDTVLRGDDCPPRVFETLVQTRKGATVLGRYNTWQEAEEGHQDALVKFQAPKAPD